MKAHIFLHSCNDHVVSIGDKSKVLSRALRPMGWCWSPFP